LCRVEFYAAVCLVYECSNEFRLYFIGVVHDYYLNSVHATHTKNC
jgi:hypothetical protein